MDVLILLGDLIPCAGNKQHHQERWWLITRSACLDNEKFGGDKSWNAIGLPEGKIMCNERPKNSMLPV